MKIPTGQTPELPGALAPADHAKPPTNPAQWVAKGAPAAQAAPRAALPVTVSIAARGLARSAEIADASDDFDADKGHAMRPTIGQGKFHVDAQAVAHKMLANAQEILSRSRALTPVAPACRRKNRCKRPSSCSIRSRPPCSRPIRPPSKSTARRSPTPPPPAPTQSRT